MIKILDDSLINKIAAGEVVERPASVIKELIENSIDANATSIFVDVNEGGKSLIKVADNGTGMNKEDAKLCCERHATSKISNTEDLFSISSLGFRGEALASISAVSKFRLITKTKDDLSGTEIKIEGKKNSIKEVGCAEGTTVIVEDLFFNTPARKKYLKTISTELGHVLDILTRYALLHPEIHFKVSHHERIVLSSPATTDTLGNISCVYGGDVAKSLIPVNYSSGEIEVIGFVSNPSFVRNDKSLQSIFVNNRYVKNSIITDAVYEAYHSMLFINKHPVIVLSITINPKQIDVNVHPTKTEIKVNREDIFHNAILEACSSALDTTLTPKVEVSVKKRTSLNRKYAIKDDKQEVLVDLDSQVEPEVVVVAKEKEAEIESVSEDVEKLPAMNVIGQINMTYILAEDENGLLIIDQHAAQERINYEKFMDEFSNKKIAVQQLMNSEVVELNPMQNEIVKENKDLLSSIGFELEDFGNNSYVLRSVPSVFGRTVNKELVIEIINELSSFDRNKVDEIKEERIIRFACRKSIKAGDELTMPYMKKLIVDLSKCKKPFSCPHGRPTLISVPIPELERKFRRIG